MPTSLTAGSGASGFSLSMPILIIFIVITLFGALKGFLRGWKRQTVRTITIVISILLSVLTAILINNEINESMAGQTLGEVLSEYSITIPDPDIENFVSRLDAETARIVAAIPVTVIVLPLLFTVVFILISLIAELLHIIICLIAGFRKRGNRITSRLLGTGIGALQGAVVSALLLFPLGCYANISDEMLTAMNDGGIKQGSEIDGIYETLDTYLSDISDNPILNATMMLGGEKLQEALSTVVIDGEEQDARELFCIITGVAGDYSYLENCDFKNPTGSEKTVMNGIKDKLTKDPYMASIISGIVRELAVTLDNGTLMLNVEEPYLSMVKEALLILKTSDSDNLGDDLNVFLNVYYQLADSGTLTAMAENTDEVLNRLTSKRDGSGNTVISKIIHTLDNYERTRPLVSLVAKLSVSIMSEQFGMDDNMIHTYDNIKYGLQGINQVDRSLPDEQYKAEVSNRIDTVLKSSNINLDTDIVDGMAKYVTDNYKNSPLPINEDNIDGIILSYYDAYLDSLNSLSPPTSN